MKYIGQKQDIDPKNNKDQFHGYQEWYNGTKLWIRCTHNHGKLIGYKETHRFLTTQFHIR